MLLLGSVLPEGDYSDDIATKGFTEEGAGKALILHEIPGEFSAQKYKKLDKRKKIIQ